MNYAIGRSVGPRVIQRRATDSALAHRLLNRDAPRRGRTSSSSSYGGKAVVLGRFVPIVRTFVPFVAGAAEMTYPTFVALQLHRARSRGSGLCLGAGLLFGNVPIVKENFSLVTIGIVVVSLLPMVVRVHLPTGGSGRPP